MESVTKMACELPTEFLCMSIQHLRIAEDSISTIVLLFTFCIILLIIHKIVKKGPLVKRLWAIILGLLPFFIWKLSGMIRRIFIEESNPLYARLDLFGETLEAVSALFILCSFVYMYFLLNHKK